MIKALIVDDEVLIRKGLIMTISWEDFGIKIVGEAGSALQALTFIENNEVDLLLTDLTMPGQSGFELIKEVAVKYPHIFPVVITCHQDFDYIQKVMRLGAIDYIVKNQIEDEEIKESLKRISNRIISEKEGKESTIWLQDIKDKNSGVLVVSRNEALESTSMHGLELLQSEIKVSINKKIVLYLIEDRKVENIKKQVLSLGSMKDPSIVFIKNMELLQQDKIFSYITNYLNNLLFYEYESSKNSYEIDAVTMKQIIPSVENDKFYQLKKEWSSILWLLNTEEFERLRLKTERLKLASIRLKSIFYKAMAEWEATLFISIPDRYEELLEKAGFWEEYLLWLFEIKKFINTKTNGSTYPEGTVSIIMNSIEYLKNNFGKDVNQEYISKMFNISRGYFSKVFKGIMGVHFTEYMKCLRIEKAKGLLIKSNNPIYMIAEEIGFQDEKYFSRVFKERTGTLPIEYRSKNRNEKQ